jgi:hypothetical protein
MDDISSKQENTVTPFNSSSSEASLSEPKSPSKFWHPLSEPLSIALLGWLPSSLGVRLRRQFYAPFLDKWDMAFTLLKAFTFTIYSAWNWAIGLPSHRVVV